MLGDPADLLGKRPPGTFVFPVSFRIKDRRVTVAQMRQLLPECATIPLNIALDFVRDRL